MVELRVSPYPAIVMHIFVYYYKYFNCERDPCRKRQRRAATAGRHHPRCRCEGPDFKAHWQPPTLRINFTGTHIDSLYKKYVTRTDLSGQISGEPKWRVGLRFGTKFAASG